MGMSLRLSKKKEKEGIPSVVRSFNAKPQQQQRGILNYNEKANLEEEEGRIEPERAVTNTRQRRDG